MDELIDILDPDGNHTGRTLMKSIAHLKGYFHQSVHIWLYTSDGKILLQQRSKNKDTYPLLWDVSVAGHIAAGEKIELAALRETKEEIGLKLEANDLQKIGVFKAVHKHHDDLIDCEFHHTFIAQLKTPLNKLQKQEEEVAALQLIPLHKFIKDTNSITDSSTYVPHGSAYYGQILKAINARL